jgi:ribonuclease HIII
LFNKRIRITRDGSFTNAQNKSTASSIAGDWSFEYLITPDGTFRLKVFTKNNYNSIATSLNNGNQMSTGFSFMHTQSFDNLAELIRRKKKAEAIVEEEDLEPKDEPKQNVPADSSETTKPTILLNKRKEDDSN